LFIYEKIPASVWNIQAFYCKIAKKSCEFYSIDFWLFWTTEICFVNFQSFDWCKSCYFRVWLATLCLVISFPLKLATRRGVARALTRGRGCRILSSLSLSLSIYLSRYIPKWSKEGKFNLKIMFVIWKCFDNNLKFDIWNDYFFINSRQNF